MANYTKALSTYKRINNIKRSTEKISEAGLMIREKQMKASAEAEDIMLNRNLASAIGQGLTTGASAGLTFGTDRFKPEEVDAISAAFGGVASGIGTVASGRLSDDSMANLTSEQRMAFLDNKANPFSDALTAYATSQQMGEAKNSMELNKFISGLSEEDKKGFSENEIRSAADSIKFIRNKGYDYKGLIGEMIRRNTEKHRTFGNID